MPDTLTPAERIERRRRLEEIARAPWSEWPGDPERPEGCEENDERMEDDDE